MTRWIRALVGGVALTLLLQTVGFVGSCDALRQSTVRLHILAHSDSAADQEMKLKVRDAVTATAATLLAEADTGTDALATLRDALPLLEATAERTLRAAGCDYPVTAELTEMYFTTREYDSGTFPAGVYDALRITIGDGAGRNWWCVVYPPLCVSAAMRTETADTALPKKQAAVVKTPRYTVRFKLVEWLSTLFS